MNGRNTLFLHLLCWKIDYSREVVDNMLKSIFMHDPYVQYIAFIKTVVGCLRMLIFFYLRALLLAVYCPSYFSDVGTQYVLAHMLSYN